MRLLVYQNVSKYRYWDSICKTNVTSTNLVKNSLYNYSSAVPIRKAVNRIIRALLTRSYNFKHIQLPFISPNIIGWVDVAWKNQREKIKFYPNSRLCPSCNTISTFLFCSYTLVYFEAYSVEFHIDTFQWIYLVPILSKRSLK